MYNFLPEEGEVIKLQKLFVSLFQMSVYSGCFVPPKPVQCYHCEKLFTANKNFGIPIEVFPLKFEFDLREPNQVKEGSNGVKRGQTGSNGVKRGKTGQAG